ncbi:hypothetical protein LINGRAHAP2_LOCUS18051 [Linum grandiflorum]
MVQEMLRSRLSRIKPSFLFHMHVTARVTLLPDGTFAKVQ